MTTAEQRAQLRLDIERRKALPPFGPDTSIERLKIINATQRSFTPDVVEALLDELERKDALQESAYKAGLTVGWNLGLENNNDKFNQCLAAHGVTVEG